MSFHDDTSAHNTVGIHFNSVSIKRLLCELSDQF